MSKKPREFFMSLGGVPVAWKRELLVFRESDRRRVPDGVEEEPGSRLEIKVIRESLFVNRYS
jgi:hypothetical protein